MIELESVTHRYKPDGPPALRSISLRVEPGERVALLGRSGAGKSTLLRCINGLVAPTAGSVRYRGQPVAGPHLRTARRAMAMIFQSFHLIESYTALGNALVGCFGRQPFWRTALGALPPAEVRLARGALDRVGIGEYAQTPVRELSGGQRQRVAIARALVQGAGVILGDEPVASLDPGAARSVLDLLLSLNRQEGLTLVLSLHDPALALAYCDRIIALRDGQILFDQRAANLSPAAVDAIYADGDPAAAIMEENSPQFSPAMRGASACGIKR
ncbi:MAG: phosphonate ABC transporter ATP-binding protein [Bacillota bacterium]